MFSTDNKVEWEGKGAGRAMGKEEGGGFQKVLFFFSYFLGIKVLVDEFCFS